MAVTDSYDRSPAKANSTGQAITVEPARIDDMLINPGKGWFIMSRAQSKGEHGDFPEAAIAYIRINWCDLEPEEGKFNWDFWDGAIERWTRLGKRIALSVMCANAHSRTMWSTPEWVKQAGAKGYIYRRQGDMYDTGAQIDRWEPDYSDPIFMAKLEQFIKAYAKRYDGNKNIEFITIRSYGIWGEWHTSHPVSNDVLERHVDMHLKYFSKTPLVVPWGSNACIPVYKYAFDKGVGFRRDGVCGPPQGREGEMYPLVWGRAPIVFELWGHYDYLKEKGWWDKYPLEAYVEKQRASYITLYHEHQAVNFCKQEPELIKRLGNRMGYWFILMKAVYPKYATRGQAINVKLEWENRGVAACLKNYPIAIFLTDNKGKTVLAWPSNLSDTRKWQPADKPDQPPPTAIEDVSLQIPENLPRGVYDVRIGLVKSADIMECVVKLGIAGRDDQGRYLLGKIEVK